MPLAIAVRNLSKCYKLGVISRKTLVDEARYWWIKVRGRDPRDHFTKIGHTATEKRRVEAEELSQNYFWALKDVSFDVEPGEVIGIIGRNGAGKSTLLKILTRITEPTKGEAVINGRVGSLLEVGTGFHPELTGRENVYMNGTILGMKKKEVDAKFDEIVAFSELEKFVDTPVKRYSSGMYVRLAFAVAAHLEPEILVVDEVLAVGDMDFQKKCLGKMEKIAAEGRTIIFVSHNMAAIQNLCNRAILFENGKIVKSDLVSVVVAKYLENNGLNNANIDVEKINDRSGNGKVRFAGFTIENSSGQTLTKVIIGEDIYLKFIIKIENGVSTDIDIGFSLHDSMNQTLSVLYSSYQGVKFQNMTKGYYSIRCLLKKYNISLPKVFVKGRIVVGREESDWPKPPIGSIETTMGDYYGSGAVSFRGQQICVLKGDWECMNI